MGRVEIDGASLQAHAMNEGVSDTMLAGSVELEGGPDGFAAVLSLRTVGKKTPVTDSLRDLVMRSLRTRSLVVRLDGEEVRSEPDENGVLRRIGVARKLPSFKRLPKGGPVLLPKDGA
jgi:hypothetical protein